MFFHLLSEDTTVLTFCCCFLAIILLKKMSSTFWCLLNLFFWGGGLVEHKFRILYSYTGVEFRWSWGTAILALEKFELMRAPRQI